LTKLASSEARNRVALAILGFADAAERDARGEIVEQALLLFLVVAGEFDEARRAGCAGRDDVDADAGALEIKRPGAGQVADGGLRGGVDGEGSGAFSAGGRAGQNDR